ncbi:hypothetical protein LCL95_10115 [Bacillus timonensis]|nr:hypothetical protein [Bacillus timonensis]
MSRDELAVKRWMALPSNERKMFEENVFCSKCGVTTIVDYEVDSINHQLVLKGHCKNCKKMVARIID